MKFEELLSQQKGKEAEFAASNFEKGEELVLVVEMTPFDS